MAPEQFSMPLLGECTFLYNALSDVVLESGQTAASPPEKQASEKGLFQYWQRGWRVYSANSYSQCSHYQVIFRLGTQFFRGYSFSKCVLKMLSWKSWSGLKITSRRKYHLRNKAFIGDPHPTSFTCDHTFRGKLSKKWSQDLKTSFRQSS